MLKKNKLPIFLLAMVVMLSVYYISETNNQGTIPDDPVSGVAKYEEYANMRLEILAERTKTIEEYEAQIASGELSNSGIEEIMVLVDSIYELNYNEVALENEIKALGYNDVFVCVENNKVNIDILTDSFSAEEFVDVTLLSKQLFDTNYIVSVHTTSTTA